MSDPSKMAEMFKYLGTIVKRDNYIYEEEVKIKFGEGMLAFGLESFVILCSA
jgi:hypothetical protein